jgi:hypothetical protein
MRMPSGCTILLLFSWLALTGVGCGDPQADGQFAGDALAELHGWIRSEQALDIVHPRLCLMWFVVAGAPDSVQMADTPVETSFPAEFRLDIVSRPPDAALNRFSDSGRLGLAYLVVYDDLNGSESLDCEGSQEPEACPDRFLGGSLDHMLAYLPDDAGLDSESAALLNGPLAAGFHLMAVARIDEDAHIQCNDACWEQHCNLPEPVDPESNCDQTAYEGCVQACGPGFDQLHPAPDGFQTEIAISVAADVEQLDFPDPF